MIKYLFYPLENLGVNFLGFNYEEIQIENNLTSFLNYKGPLKKIVFIEEFTFMNLPDDYKNLELLNVKDTIWIGSFGSGAVRYQFEKFKTFLDNHQIKYSDVCILTHTNYEFKILDELFTTEKPFYYAASFCNLIAFKEILNPIKRKRFLFLSRNWSRNRLLSFVDLARRGVLNNTYYSFFNIKNIYKPIEESFSYYNLNELTVELQRSLESTTNKKWKSDILDFWNTFKYDLFRSMPYTIPGELEDQRGIGSQYISHAISKCFEDSYFSLIPETFMYDNNPEMFQITEKTAKSVYYRHPFMIYANTDTVKRLNAYTGFKSFNKYIDESYDSCKTVSDRIYKINDQVEYLNSMEMPDFKELMFKMTEVTSYNYQVLMQRMLNYKKLIIKNRPNNVIDNLIMNTYPKEWY